MSKARKQQSPALDFDVPDHEVRLWFERIREAEAEAKPFLDKGKEFRTEWLGKHYPPTSDAEPRLANYMASYLSVFAPMLYFQDPTVYVESTLGEPEYEQAAKLLEGRINQLLGPMEFSEQVEEALQDSFFSVGIPMGQYVVPSGDGRQEPEPDDERHGDSRTVDVHAAEAGYDEYLDPGHPGVPRVKPEEFLVDPASANLKTAAWCRRIVWRRLEDLRLDDRYDVPEDLKATHNWKAVKGREDQQATESDPLNQWVKLHEIWTDAGRKIITLADGYRERPLRTANVDTGIEGYPFRILRLQRVNDQFYPPTPFAAWFEAHKSHNELRQHLDELAKSIKSVTLVEGNAGQELIDLLQTAQNGDIIPVQKLRDAINATLGSLPKEAQNWAESVKADLDRISGISDFIRGVPISGSTTATEIDMLNAQHDLRIARAKKFVKDWIEDVLAMIGTLVFNYSVETVPVRLKVGARAEWAMFSPEALAGEVVDYLFKIEQGSQTRKTPAERQKRSEQMLALVGNPQMRQAIAEEGVQAAITPHIEDWLDADGVRDLDRYLIPMQPQAPGMSPADLAVAGHQPQQYAREEAWRENQALLETGEMPAAQPGQDHQTHVEQHDELQRMIVESLEASDRVPAPIPEEQARAMLQYLGEHVGEHGVIEQQDMMQQAMMQAMQQAAAQ
ncbi:MAG: portal protein, partial [Pseudomonadota bacterium]